MIPALVQVGNPVVGVMIGPPDAAIAAGAMPVAGQVATVNSRKRKAEAVQDLGGPITVAEVEAIQTHASQVESRAAGGLAAPAWFGPALAIAFGPALAIALGPLVASLANTRVHKRNSQAMALMGGNPALEAPVTESGMWGAPIPAALIPVAGVPAAVAAILAGGAPPPNTVIPGALLALIPTRDGQAARWEIAALGRWFNTTFGIVIGDGTPLRNQKLKDWLCGA